MSHFKVLVIGEDIDGQLEPYNEHTQVEAYPEPGFDFAKELERARSFYERNPDLEPDLDRSSDHAVLTTYKEGEDLRWNEDKTSACVWSTYNPNSKWDYWVIGGRFNANFKVKPDTPQDDFVPSEVHWSEGFGNVADHTNASDRARKRAIDYPAMIAARREDAEKQWEKLTAATEGLTPPETGWSGYREAHADIEEARKAWGSHPWVSATRRAGFFDAYEDFFIGGENPQQAYIAHRETMAVTGFYAIVKDGKWLARGDMGWFGMSRNEANDTEWRDRVRDLIEELPDDTWLTTVDCHI